LYADSGRACQLERKRGFDAAQSGDFVYVDLSAHTRGAMVRRGLERAMHALGYF
jgi:hypothetical protein